MTMSPGMIEGFMRRLEKDGEEAARRRLERASYFSPEERDLAEEFVRQKEEDREGARRLAEVDRAAITAGGGGWMRLASLGSPTASPRTPRGGRRRPSG